MEVLEEALYGHGLDGCDGLVDQCVKGASEGAEKSFAPMSESSVQKLHEKLKAVLDKRLIALGIADGAPTMHRMAGVHARFGMREGRLVRE